MKISIKYKPDEIQCLAGMLEQALDGNYRGNRKDAIINLIITNFYLKIKKKSILVDRPVKITITPEEALSFVEYFENVPIDITTFGGNILHRMIHKLDSKTSKYY